MTACEVAWSRLPQAGMQVHRGLLYDQMNQQAVARHAIASQPATLQDILGASVLLTHSL